MASPQTLGFALALQDYATSIADVIWKDGNIVALIIDSTLIDDRQLSALIVRSYNCGAELLNVYSPSLAEHYPNERNR